MKEISCVNVDVTNHERPVSSCGLSTFWF